jgi:hypothetical protein
VKNRDVMYLQLLLTLYCADALIGRRGLAAELKVGEGVVRTLLRVGRALGHVVASRGGARVSSAGIAFIREVLGLCGVLDVFVIHEARELLCGRKCIAYVTDDSVNNVTAFRDELVRLGACGALILERSRGVWKIPPIDAPLAEFSWPLADLLDSRVKSGSTVVISCGETFSDALGLVVLKCARLLGPCSRRERAARRTASIDARRGPAGDDRSPADCNDRRHPI